MNNNDRHWMECALEMGAQGKGWNSPRPSVGCVLVRDGKIIGSGHTQRGDGQPHAEIMAIRDAAARQESAFGATAYVTLEPCSHYATTPPCTGKLIEAGVARVVAGVRDPNPAVNGRGYQQLQEAGIEVVQNFMARECARHHEHFLKHISTSMPFVTLKSAVSLDGKIALNDGSSQWISGPASRQRAHFLRHCHDAVLVGAATAMADNPHLSVRLEGNHQQPARVVLDGRGVISADLQLFDKSTFNVPVYVATTAQMSEPKQKELEQRGAKVLSLPEKNGHVDLTALLRELYAQGICSVLVEGGAHLSGALLHEQLVDKVVCYVAPLIVGEGMSWAEGLKVDSLNDALRLQDVQTACAGEDVEFCGYLEPWATRMRQLCEETPH